MESTEEDDYVPSIESITPQFINLTLKRISEEVVEMEHELIELRKHISSQGILVQDLMTGVCCELDGWNWANADMNDTPPDPEISEVQDPLANKMDDHKKIFLEKIDVLLAEHEVEEAQEALEAEE
ncbi:hypothetical protein QQP08_019044 [Theobroma cacao]|nr:hypothetical protein QQP08_019044 [Theobroma cacao]